MYEKFHSKLHSCNLQLVEVGQYLVEVEVYGVLNKSSNWFYSTSSGWFLSDKNGMSNNCQQLLEQMSVLSMWLSVIL